MNFQSQLCEIRAPLYFLEFVAICFGIPIRLDLLSFDFGIGTYQEFLPNLT
jgi:hypothetical protein